MGQFLRVKTNYFILVTISILALCQDGFAAQKETAATVDRPVKESELTTIKLTEMAEQRLGIETVSVKSKDLPGVLTIGGEIMAVPGKDVSVTAPVGGTVGYARGGSSTIVGKTVNKGEEVMRLLLLPPDKSLTTAKEEVTLKETAYKVVLEQFNREKTLLSKNATSEKAFQQAEAALAAAQGELSSAKEQLRLLNSNLDAADGDISVIKILSPFSGVIHKVFVGSGQVVAEAAPLFQISEQDPVWVCVPVYVGDLSKIDLTKNAAVNPMMQTASEDTLSAEPVKGPPTSNLSNVTSDIFYRLDNKDGNLRIGQKVLVSLTKKAETGSYTVPYSSIVYDIYGGSWVYVKAAAQTYTRKRVEISHVIDNNAVISRGVSTGDQVVISGAAEIFGAEFGGQK